MVTDSNVASILPKWYSVSVRFFVPTETTDCQMFYMTILAPSSEVAMEIASMLFVQTCFSTETNNFHSPVTGGILLPWHVSAIEIPEPFAAALHARMADELKKVRLKREKKNNMRGGKVLELHKKSKKVEDPSEGKPPKDDPPKAPKT